MLCVSHLISFDLSSFIYKMRRLKNNFRHVNSCQCLESMTQSLKAEIFCFYDDKYFPTAVNILRRKSEKTIVSYPQIFWHCINVPLCSSCNKKVFMATHKVFPGSSAG